MEDPLGILNQIDTANVALYQASDAAQITGQASAYDGLFLVNYSGKKLAIQNGVFGASPSSKTTKFYQDLTLLSGSNQKINKISFGQRANLETGLFTGNSLTSINFNKYSIKYIYVWAPKKTIKLLPKHKNIIYKDHIKFINHLNRLL
jgi:hypothetical protein